MDLRANNQSDSSSQSAIPQGFTDDLTDPWTARLMIGSQIAAEVRAAMKVTLMNIWHLLYSFTGRANLLKICSRVLLLGMNMFSPYK